MELLHFFLLTFVLVLLQNLDLMLVNRFFAGDVAGKYALISVIMKFVIFIAVSVEIVYYPKLSHPNFYKRDLFDAIALLLLGSIIGYILLSYF
jgi:O-antigen/teichoic acid export membrane protein